MKRLWVAVILLLICGAFSTAEFITVRKNCDYYTQLLDTAEAYISSKEYSEASAIIESAQHQWESTQKTLNVFLLHEEAESIGENLAQLNENANEKDRAKFKSVADKIKRQLLRLKQSELPDFENIL